MKCAIIAGSRIKPCGGQCYRLDQGDLSYLKLLSSKTNEFAIVDSDHICLYHYDTYIKTKFSTV
jgi:hypothetical protein